MPSITQLIQQSTTQLEVTSDSALLDVELLLCSVLKKDRSYLKAWPENELSPEQINTFQDYLDLRIHGLPIAHILGERGFWSLDLIVTSDTLIPRPDTERLVELALEHIPEKADWKILDLGTGSGAIALSLAKERPSCHFVATDRSITALEIAKLNAKKNHITNINFILSDWFSALTDEQRSFDIIVSNPPYIKENDPHLNQGDVRFEPRSALTAGEDGLDDIRIIINSSQQYLSQNGVLLIEHGYDQAEAVCNLLKDANYSQVNDFKDDNGNPRVAVGHIKQLLINLYKRI